MNTNFYKDKKVLVTGGCGFLGRHLTHCLLEKGAKVRAVGRRQRPADLSEAIAYLRLDLTEKKNALDAVRGMDYVFHLASVGWGFHENLKQQARVLTENLLLNTTVLDSAYKTGVSRYLFTSSVGVYPADSRKMEEDDPLEKPPHDSEKYYAWSKRMGEIQAKAFYENYHFPIAIVRPSNPYGPHDDFNPETAHVIPSLIKRAVQGENPFTVWGTGTPVRSFIYAEDVAMGMMAALEKCCDCSPINLSSSEAISIAGLSEKVLMACNRDASEIRFDVQKRDGHPFRVPSVEKAGDKLKLKAYVPLEEGLKRTVNWYLGRADQTVSQQYRF